MEVLGELAKDTTRTDELWIECFKCQAMPGEICRRNRSDPKYGQSHQARFLHRKRARDDDVFSWPRKQLGPTEER